MIQFKKPASRDLADALSREWLETNGLGGFASSTVIGLNTRRYHVPAGSRDQAASGSLRAALKGRGDPFH